MTGRQTSLSELSEADATGAIAAIYRDMRRYTGAPMVALIWRHLATRPGVLPAVWHVLEPVYRAGVIQDAAWRTVERVVAGPAASTGPQALRRSGLEAEDIRAFTRVLDAYNRVNPVNYVAVRLLLDADAARRVASAAVAAQPVHCWRPPEAIGALPSMAAVTAIPSSLRALIDDLSSDPRVDRALVVPTLYRHLTGWPDLIPAIHAALAPRFRSGEIGRTIAALAAALDSEAARLAEATRPLVASEAGGDIMPTLQQFASLIPEMVVVGTLLRRGIDRPG